MAMARSTAKKDSSTVIGPYDFREKTFCDRATIYDYAKLATLMASLPGSAMCVVLYRQYKWMRGSPQHIALKDSLLQAAIDSFTYNLTWRQLRIVAPLRPLRVELDSMRCSSLPGYNNYFGGTNYSARWLCEVENRSIDDPVILYLHGGSYAMKTQRPQISYLISLAKMWSHYRVSILILDYTIGPFAKFPTQLNEAMACYEELTKSCNQILALGDSCGGHLALDMLMSGARFNLGCALISPSTDMTSGAPDDISMREVFVDPEVYKYDDPLISPLYADPSIWPKILPKNTAIVWGESEICKPQMIEWANLAKVRAVFEEPHGGHDCILRGRKNRGSVFIQQQMEGWLISLMGNQSQVSSGRPPYKYTRASRSDSLIPLVGSIKEKLSILPGYSNKSAGSTSELNLHGSKVAPSENQLTATNGGVGIDLEHTPRTIS